MLVPRIHVRLVLTCLLLTRVCIVSGAWQKIADYTDCGSMGFVTQTILANFGEVNEGYWLNLSIVGDFSVPVVDASNTTNRASTIHC
jgi:hypothetical protein